MLFASEEAAGGSADWLSRSESAERGGEAVRSGRLARVDATNGVDFCFKDDQRDESGRQLNRSQCRQGPQTNEAGNK